MVRRSRKPRWEKGERRRGRELSATLLPVLVKCCVLSKRQPRMCQPSRLTLPNGLLNADIKLTRSFRPPPFPLSLSLSLSFCLCRSLSLPLVLTLSLTLSLTCPLPLFHPLSVALSINLSLPVFSFFPVAVFLLLLTSPSITPLKLSCRLLLYLQLFFMDELNTSVSLSLSLSLSPSLLPTGSIMHSTQRIHPSRSPCCMSCRRRSTVWQMPSSLAWIGTGGASLAQLECR